MAYAIVVVVSAVVGASAYVITIRRSSPEGSSSFDPRGPEPADEPASDPDVSYIPVGDDARISWQSRSISVLGLVALVMVVASAIAVSLYQVGGMLVRFVIHKLQNS